MNRFVSIVLVFFSVFTLSNAQEKMQFTSSTSPETTKVSFKQGEWLKFRIHYGFVNAGYATLKLKQSNKQGKPVFHAIGKGWTVGAAKIFFKIKDNYESHFTSDEIKPIRFKRRVDEGGYTIRRDLFFDHHRKKVTIEDLDENTTTEMSFNDVQDMVSAFYYLRNYDLSKYSAGDEISVNLFFDGEVYPFKLKFVKREIISTKYGKIRTWRIQPLVQKGRVFEGQESLTVWISDDDNKIPIRIKASLAVGSLKADLEEFKGLANPFTMIKE